MATNFHIEDGHPLKEYSKQAIHNLLCKSPLGEIYIINIKDEIIGYVALMFTMSIEFGGKIIILDDFYLKPQFRGKGLGKSALNKIIDLCTSLNAVQIFLEVEFNNIQARNLYQSFSFKIRNRNMMSLDLIDNFAK